MKNDLFFVDCQRDSKLFFHRGNWKQQLHGCLATRIRVGIFDFYIVFLPNQVHVVRAYKNGVKTGKTAGFYTKSWTQICQRFPILIPHAKALQRLTDEVWSCNRGVCRVEHINSFFDLMPR